MKTLLICIFIFLTFSCQSKTQKDISEISQIYVDILVVEETYRGVPDSLVVNKNKIFEDYGVTEKKYNESLRGMEQSSEEWNLFFENALAYLDSLKKIGKPVKIDSLQVQP